MTCIFRLKGLRKLRGMGDLRGLKEKGLRGEDLEAGVISGPEDLSVLVLGIV